VHLLRSNHVSRGFLTCRVTSDLSERSKQLQSAQTDAHQAFQQSKAQHADLLNQLQTAQLATQQAQDAQIEAEQQLQTTQQASALQLNQVIADFDQQVHAAKHSAHEESSEKLQILQQEYEHQLAAAVTEADQKLSAVSSCKQHKAMPSSSSFKSMTCSIKLMLSCK